MEQGDSNGHGVSESHINSNTCSVEPNQFTASEVVDCDDEDNEDTPLILQTLATCNLSLDVEAGKRVFTVANDTDIIDAPLIEFEKSPAPTITTKSTKDGVNNII